MKELWLVPAGLWHNYSRTPVEEGRVQGLATADLQGEDRPGLLKCSFNTHSCHPVGYSYLGKLLCWANKRQISRALKVLPSLFNISQIHQPSIDREMSLAKKPHQILRSNPCHGTAHMAFPKI